MAERSYFEILARWLQRRGLRANPFGMWNAESDPNLPAYFVDVGGFDELLALQEPCVILAARGRGKTAHRQMLATQCRPIDMTSDKLAISYTYESFERLLSRTGNSLAAIEPSHHIAEILRIGVEALWNLVQSDPDVFPRPAGTEHLYVLEELRARTAHFTAAESLETNGGARVSDVLGIGNLRVFGQLIHAAGLSACLVLVDRLDEFPLTADNPANIAALLEPLLGTLPIIETSGLAFKAFLPMETEKELHEHLWFRPDRLHVFRINWTANSLRQLIAARLAYYSTDNRSPIQAIGQLCDDDLGVFIDDDLVALAEGLPRSALMLADQLLRKHCSQPNPPNKVTNETWQAVAKEWSELHRTTPAQSDQSTDEAALRASSWTHLQGLFFVDEGSRRVSFNSVELGLTPKEYAILTAFLGSIAGFQSKDELRDAAWSKDEPSGVSDETIAANISRLRRKLSSHCSGMVAVETVTGQGYRLKLA